MIFRRIAIFIPGTVFAASVTLGAATPARAAACGTLLPLAVPACGALWGISVPGGSSATLAADEKTVGRVFDISYHFHSVGDQLPTASEVSEVASGHLLHVNIESTNYAAVISGSQDAGLIRQAQGVKSLKAPVYVTFTHEPDVKSKVSRGTPAQFVAAWRHVHNLFVANGATNAVWVWIMVGWYPNFPGYAGFYPGNDVVDWISWEGYSTTGCGTGRNALNGTFATSVGPMYTWLHDGHGVAAGIDISKPEMISEYGANFDSANPGAQGAWYQGIPTLLKTQFPDIKAVAKWDNQGGNCRYDMAESPLTIAGVTAAGHDPYVNQTPPVSGPPHAAFAPSCVGDACTFDASASTAPGSSITSYAWDFGDGTTGTGESASNTFAAEGSYQVTLTVTDGNGQTDAVTETVTTPPPAPVAAFTFNCSGTKCSFDGSGSSASESAITSYAWDFGDGASATGGSATHTYATGGSYSVTLTVTDGAGDQKAVTHTANPAAPPAIAFVAAASTNANATSEAVKIPSTVTAGDGLVLIATGAGGGVLTGPVGWTKLDVATVSSIYSISYERVATAGDAGSMVTVKFPAIEHGTVQLLAYSGTSAADPVAAYAKSAASLTATKYTSPTVTAPTAGDVTLTYWACKSSSVTKWTVPASQTVRSTAYGSGGGRITSVFGDAGGGAAGTTGGSTASPDTSASAFAAWTIVLG
jgi:PKD repeat protein